MGAKAPVRLKTRQPTCKCDLCGSSFLSIQALRTHQAYQHPKAKRLAYKPKTEVIAKRKSMPLRKNKNTSTKVGNPPKVKEVKEKSEEVENKDNSSRRSAFECPACSKIFKVYFSAVRHIQNNHCFNDKGEAVSPNSPTIIKPTSIEQCTKCNLKVDTEEHFCSELVIEENPKGTLKCLGCEQEFKLRQTFDNHISRVHNDDAMLMFFPDMDKFNLWKKSLETETEKKYIIMQRKNNLQVFHCNHKESNENLCMLCPSSISVQVFTKGVQAFFYKQHAGHKSKEYILPEIYQKYHITSVKNTEGYTDIEDSESNSALYLELKKQVETVIVRAAKANDATLKQLITKALDMLNVIEQNDEQNEAQTVNMNRSMTDDEISQLLDTPQQKRKIEQTSTNAKRIKRDVVAKVEPRVRKDSENRDMETASKNTEEEKDTLTKLSTEDDNDAKINTKQDAEDVKDSKIKLETDKRKTIESPTSFSDSYKIFVDSTIKKTDGQTPKRVKTRMGQFKPNILSKAKGDVKGEVKENLPKINKILPKVDFEYEVLEQDNDCNILLIKI